MIPNQDFSVYPVFGDSAAKAAPDSAKYSAGFQEADVLPAEWMNWAWFHNTKGITDLNKGVKSIEAELNNIITAGGETPTEETNNQVLNAIKYVIATLFAPIAHADTTAKYGVGSESKFGHVKITPGNGLDIADGTVTMGQASASDYGSAKVVDTLTQLTHTAGVALSAHQGYILKANQFGNGTAAVTGNAIAVTLTNFSNITSLEEGARFRVVFGADYATESQPTMTINGGSEYPVTVGNVPAGVGAFQNGKSYEFTFTGTSYDCLSHANGVHFVAPDYGNEILLSANNNINTGIIQKNGYLRLYTVGTSSYLYVMLNNVDNNLIVGSGESLFFPVYKGDTWKITRIGYNAYLYFIPIREI